MIPCSVNLYCMRRNDRRYGWVEHLLDALRGNTVGLSREEACTNIILHVGSIEEYEPAFATTGESLGVSTIRKLDEKTSFAIQSSANMNYAQMRELQRNFCIVLGCPVFPSEYRIKQLMGSEFVAPALTGVYYYGKQRVDWACKNADNMLLVYLSQYGR